MVEKDKNISMVESEEGNYALRRGSVGGISEGEEEGGEEEGGGRISSRPVSGGGDSEGEDGEEGESGSETSSTKRTGAIGTGSRTGGAGGGNENNEEGGFEKDWLGVPSYWPGWFSNTPAAGPARPSLSQTLNPPLTDLLSISNGAIILSNGATFTTEDAANSAKGALGLYHHGSATSDTLYIADNYDWGVTFPNPNGSKPLVSVTFYAEKITQIGQKAGVWLGDGIDGDPGTYENWTYVGYSSLSAGADSEIIIFSRNGSLLEGTQDYVAIIAFPADMLTQAASQTAASVLFAVTGTVVSS